MSIIQSLCRRSRTLNAYVNVFEAAMGRTRIASLPLSMGIGVTTICNADCIFCLRESVKTKSHQTLDNLKRLLDPVIDTLQEVGLEGNGEVLTNKDFLPFFHYLRDHGVDCYLITNGILLNAEVVEVLLSRGLREVTISLNAMTPAIYREIMRIDGCAAAKTNVEKLVELRNQRGTVRPRITLSMVVLNKNLADLPPFLEFARRLQVDQVAVRPLTGLRENMEQNFDICATSMEEYQGLHLTPEQNEEVIRQLDEFVKVPRPALVSNRDLFRNRSRVSPAMVSTESSHGLRPPCDLPWMSYNNYFTDGRINVCCLTTEAHYAAGNGLRDQFPDIWNGPIYQQFRRTVNSDDPIPTCRDCAYRVQRRGPLTDLLRRLGGSLRRKLPTRGF